MNLVMNSLILAAAPGAGGQAGGLEGMLMTVISFGLMIVIFYFLLIRPEKKRAKKLKQMLEDIQIADEVVTTGGIIGRVLSVKEDTVLIETGSDRTRIRVLKSAITENRTIHDTKE